MNGYLFFHGVPSGSVREFYELHRAEIDAAITDPRSAIGIWLDNVYVEYRPNLRQYDGYIELEFGGE